MSRWLLGLALLAASVGCVKDHSCREGTVFVTVKFRDSRQLVDGVAMKYQLDGGSFGDVSPPISRPADSDEGTLELTVKDYAKHSKLTLQYVPTRGGAPVGNWQSWSADLSTACVAASLDIRISPNDAGAGPSPEIGTLADAPSGDPAVTSGPPDAVFGPDAGPDSKPDLDPDLGPDMEPDTVPDLGIDVPQSGDVMEAQMVADAGADEPVISTGGALGTGGISGTAGVTGKGGAAGMGGIMGSGGGTGSGGATGTGGCGALIDDMESGTGLICQTTGRKGAWYTYIDSSSYSAISPRTSVMALPELMSTPRTSTSTRAMHISGAYSTYAGLACWLNNVSFGTIPGTYNGSSYTGIKFYAKGKGSLIVVGQMPATESYLYGGTCPSSSCAGNQYRVGALTSSWTLYTVPFSYLTGGDAEPFDPSEIWSLEFMFYSATSLYGAAFDLWVDDLTFY